LVVLKRCPLWIERTCACAASQFSRRAASAAAVSADFLSSAAFSCCRFWNAASGESGFLGVLARRGGGRRGAARGRRPQARHLGAGRRRVAVLHAAVLVDPAELLRERGRCRGETDQEQEKPFHWPRV
jgi:hypothetical protein